LLKNDWAPVLCCISNYPKRLNAVSDMELHLRDRGSDICATGVSIRVEHHHGMDATYRLCRYIRVARGMLR
jgi:hypothetical protein